MIKNKVLSTLALTAVLAAGCNQQSPETAGGTNSAASETSMTASNAWQSTKEGSSNLWNATKNATTNAWQDTKEAGSNAWEKAKAAVGDVSTNEVSTNYFSDDYSMKDSFVSQAQASLDQLDQRTSKFTNQVAQASDTTKANLQQQVEAVTVKRTELGTQYDNVKNATEANWDDAKAAFVKAYFDAKATLKAGKDALAAKI